jgi:hypothetical protein
MLFFVNQSKASKFGRKTCSLDACVQHNTPLPPQSADQSHTRLHAKTASVIPESAKIKLFSANGSAGLSTLTLYIGSGLTVVGMRSREYFVFIFNPVPRSAHTRQLNNLVFNLGSVRWAGIPRSKGGIAMKGLNKPARGQRSAALGSGRPTH